MPDAAGKTEAKADQPNEPKLPPGGTGRAVTPSSSALDNSIVPADPEGSELREDHPDIGQPTVSEDDNRSIAPKNDADELAARNDDEIFRRIKQNIERYVEPDWKLASQSDRDRIIVEVLGYRVAVVVDSTAI